MKKLIVNADDFGRHELINAGIERAFTSGICRSASIMAGGSAFDDAVKIAKSHKNLGIGVHFTLVMGNSVLPHSEIPSLVDNNGKFCDDYIIFAKRYLTGRISINEIRRELSAQLPKIISSRLKISHVDSHQHIHVLPGILEIIMDLADKANIHAIRIPQIKGLNFSVGKMGLKILSLIANIRQQERGLLFLIILRE
ncbi:MAG: ChbG/HpnK family deacetylase [Synergistaceae bacterium]|nr:ChbG/HpnK family deacetylase [Synergistaceae bacterium]